MPQSRESAAKEALEREAGEVKEIREAGEVSEATYSIDVGFEVESTRSDGEPVHETAVATSETDGYTIVLAREGVKQTRLRVVDAKEQAAESQAGEQLDLFLDVAERTTESAIKAAGLKGAEAEKARTSIEAELPGIVAQALGEKNPEKVLTQAIQDAAEAIANKEAIPTPNLEELTLILAHARQKTDSAKSDKEYAAALAEIHAAEKAVYEARVALHPEAAPEEKAAIADEADGAIELLPDPIYEKGHLDILGSIQKLEGSMREADVKKDAVAWTVARNERDRHMAILPILEKVDALEKAQIEVDAAIEQLEEEKKAKVGKKKENLEKHRLSLQEIMQKKDDLIKSLEDQMRDLDKKPKKGAEEEFSKLDKQRREARAVIEGAQRILQKFIKETKAFEKAGIELPFDPNTKPDAARTALYHQLRDMHEQNPGLVMDYVEGTLKSEKIAESTRQILEIFAEDVKSEVHGKETVEMRATEVEEVEEIPTVIYSEYKVPDLIAAGIVEKADDLAALEKTFVELNIAMESLGLEPKDEGLPSSFKEMLKTKDSRGFLGKLFNKKTDRAKLFEKLSRAYYTYVASGKVDVKKYLANQKMRYEDYSEKMKRAGRL